MHFLWWCGVWPRAVFFLWHEHEDAKHELMPRPYPSSFTCQHKPKGKSPCEKNNSCTMPYVENCAGAPPREIVLTSCLGSAYTNKRLQQQESTPSRRREGIIRPCMCDDLFVRENAALSFRPRVPATAAFQVMQNSSYWDCTDRAQRPCV